MTPGPRARRQAYGLGRARHPSAFRNLRLYRFVERGASSDDSASMEAGLSGHSPSSA